MGEGRSEPASLELVVWLEELRDSTLQDDISNDRGLEVFIRTLLSNVDTLKRRTLLLQDFLHELPTFAGKWCATSMLLGGFQLVDLIITELKNHTTCYNFECSHWWKIYLQKDLLSRLNAVI